MQKFKNLPLWAKAGIALAISIAGLFGLKEPIQDEICSGYKPAAAASAESK